MNLTQLEKLIAAGESESLELKKSTAQLKPASETLCAFLNSGGGRVIIGVTPEGRITGQQVSDKTQRDVASVIKKFEPPAPVEIEYVDLPNSPVLKLIVLSATSLKNAGPFTFDGRAYHRIGTTTSIMPQERYEKLLLERMHVRHRWENQPAGIEIGHLDEEEILRTAVRGASSGRLPESVGTDAGDLLERLGLSIDGSISNAAAVLFGVRLFPDILSASFAWRGSRAPTKRSSSIIGKCTETLFGFWMRPCCSCGATCRSPGVSSQGFSKGWTSPCSLRWLCAKLWSTPFATGITLSLAAP
ncbi:MAG: AlbA family DNA-binding domain-containing protein [Rubrobacteraceae bacterium]